MAIEKNDSPDGVKVELQTGTTFGQPGETVILSASVAKAEIAKGAAKEFVEEEPAPQAPTPPADSTPPGATGAAEGTTENPTT